MSSDSQLQDVMAESRNFPERFQTLHLATCNETGDPDASYAPYIAEDGAYYVYVSELSPHTANLAASGRCSALFIESEAEARHLFARRRLTLHCTATEQQRGSAEFERLMGLFAAKFGNFMEMLRTLDDFHLYRLQPNEGSYVKGFGQAYVLEGEGLKTIRHRQEQGHRRQGKIVAPDAVAEQ